MNIKQKVGLLIPSPPPAFQDFSTLNRDLHIKNLYFYTSGIQNQFTLWLLKFEVATLLCIQNLYTFWLLKCEVATLL